MAKPNIAIPSELPKKNLKKQEDGIKEMIHEESKPSVLKVKEEKKCLEQA